MAETSEKDAQRLMKELQFQQLCGTIRDSDAFSVSRDAEALRNAMKGAGTDENAIIEVAANRSNKQRLKIRTEYSQLFGRDLMKDLESELSGHFRELAVALFEPLTVFNAQCLHRAIKGLGTTESALVGILASHTNQEIKAIKAAYQKEYQSDLEKDIRGDTSGDFENLLVALCAAARDDPKSAVDEKGALADAEELYRAGEKRLGTDEAAFIRILCRRSFPELRAIFKAYNKIANKDIIESISSEFSGDIKQGLIAVVQIIRSSPAYFAMRFNRSMKGLGTKDTALIWLVVTRAEVDMVQIKEAYQKMFNTSLEKAIEDDTSGDYGKLLLALIH